MDKTFTEIKQEELNEMLGEKPSELKAARMAETAMLGYIREVKKGFDILADSYDQSFMKYFWTMVMLALAIVCLFAGVAALHHKEKQEIIAAIKETKPEKVSVSTETADLAKLISEGQQNTNMLLGTLVDNIANLNARPQVIYRTRYIQAKPKKKARRHARKRR